MESQTQKNLEILTTKNKIMIDKQIKKQIKLKTQGLEDNLLDQHQLQSEIEKTEKYLESMINKLSDLRYMEIRLRDRLSHLKEQ